MRERGRRESVAEGAKPGENKRAEGGKHGGCPRDRSQLFGRLAWIWEERGSEAGARLGGSGGQDLFLKLCSLEPRFPTEAPCTTLAAKASAKQ